MSGAFRVDLGCPALLEFRGPDAVRFLNGQLTQDVKKVSGSDRALPSCVTDAKGKLQFRVYLLEHEGALLVSAPEGLAEALEARLTKYLIADDVEVTDLSGKYRLHHLIGAVVPATGESFAKHASRFGVDGVDLWIPVAQPAEFPEGLREIGEDELEAFRICRIAPAWGAELTEGMLPPEANLDVTDISYHKGCYIGQEVISRIKSAGKLNRQLLGLTILSEIAPQPGDELISDGVTAGILTSVSPHAGKVRDALGYVKRSADRNDLQVKLADGTVVEVQMRCAS